MNRRLRNVSSFKEQEKILDEFLPTRAAHKVKKIPRRPCPDCGVLRMALSWPCPRTIENPDYPCPGAWDYETNKKIQEIFRKENPQFTAGGSGKEGTPMSLKSGP
jgi:hypothetical protein